MASKTIFSTDQLPNLNNTLTKHSELNFSNIDSHSLNTMYFSLATCEWYELFILTGCHINIGFRFSRLLWLTHHDVCSSYLAGFQRKEYHLCISLMMMAYSFHCFPILLLHFATHWQDPVDPLGECSQTCCFLSVQPEEGKGKDAHFLVFMSSTLLTSIQFLVNKLREYKILTK